MMRIRRTLAYKIGRRQGRRIGREEGLRQGRLEAVAFLYAQADIHHDEPSDQKRRAALHHAADRLRDGRGVGRP